MKLLNFINGKFKEPCGGLFFSSLNPATEDVLYECPDSCSADVEEAVQAAKSAFPSWSSTSKSHRANLMNMIADALEANLNDFALAESKDQGKPLSLATSVDIPRAILNFRYFASLIMNKCEISSHLDGIAVSRTESSPIGIVGLISPWNLPLYLLTWKIAPALAAGNCIVAKPSEITSLTAFKLCEIVKGILPAGVLNMIFGNGLNAGNSIVSHPEITAISFTGGTVTGKAIAETAGPLLKKISLELGGKNATIIFEDADLEDSAFSTLVRSCFSNQGEICLCGSRIFVHQSIFDSFCTRFTENVKKAIKMGNPLDSTVTMGPVVSWQHYEKIKSFIQIAKDDGGRFLLSSDDFTIPQKGFFIPPHIVTDLSPNSRCMQQEIFGPVVCIHPFQTEDEVVQWANGTQYGLSASIWTRSIKRAQRIASSLQAGTVWINCWMIRDLHMPFGGWKSSGVGMEGGLHSLEFFSQTKTICSAL